MPDRRMFSKQALAVLSIPWLSTTPGGQRAEAQAVDGVTWQSNAFGAYSYNTDQQLRSTAIAHTITEAGVQQVIEGLRGARSPFAIRSSGHCFAGLSQNAGTVIDLAGMNTVRFGQNDRIIAQPAARLGDVYALTGPRQRVLPAGFCQNVALGGHVTGGAIGPYSRAFGLGCDAMRRARIVLANGEVVEASAQDNPDLFWALRGGGAANFGVLTEAEFESFQTGEVSVLRYYWEDSPQAVATVIEQWQRRAPSLPRRMGSMMFIRALGRDIVQARGYLVSFDTQERARQAALDFYDIARPSIDPRIAIGNPDQIAENIWPRSYNPSEPRKVISTFQTAPTPAANWRILLDRLKDDPAWPVSVNLDLMGGAIDDVAPDATGFPHRGVATMTAQFDVVLDPDQPRAPQVTRLADLAQLVADQAAEGRAYLNYADRDLTDYANAYWGQNLERLQRIKAEYDPLNLFRGPQSIPPIDL